MLLRITRRLRDARESEEGFTVIEVMVAMTIFAIIAAGIATGIVGSLVLSKDSRAREIASTIAMNDIDTLRDADSLFDVVSDTQTVRSGDMAFTRERAVTWTRSSGTSNACGTGTGTLAYKAVTETVSWSSSHSSSGSQSFTMSTAIAPLSNINSDTTGSILIGVSDASGTGVPGITPTITGPSGVAVPATNVEGCTYVTGVATGTYTVKVSRAGYVDGAQQSPSEQSVIVAAGSSGAAAFTYDAAANYAVQYGNAKNVAATLATNMPATLINPTSGTVALTNSASSASLFPYTAGYRAVAGTFTADASGTASPTSCVNTEPGSWVTANAAGRKGVPSQPSASPLKAQTGALTLKGLTTGQYITAKTITPVTGSGDPGCALGMTLTFPKLTGTTTTLALPWGTWKLYSGASSGLMTTVVNGSASNVTFVTNGSVVSGAVMLDPRAAS